jgi:hypothetical protein
VTDTPANPVDVEQTVQRLRELSEQTLQASKENGAAWLSAYESVLNNVLKLQQQAADSTQVEWVNTIANTNAEMVREMSQLYLNAVREHVK